ncbi:unnamed protein product, partial [Linum tenue]
MDGIIEVKESSIRREGKAAKKGLQLEMQSIWIEAKAEGKLVSSREIVQKVLKKKVKYGPK